jgi:hypothetical protein
MVTAYGDDERRRLAGEHAPDREHSARAPQRTFSEHSYSFRPGRSAHQAVAQAQRYVAEGYGVVVDLDLEKFFDPGQSRQFDGARRRAGDR